MVNVCEMTYLVRLVSGTFAVTVRRCFGITSSSEMNSQLLGIEGHILPEPRVRCEFTLLVKDVRSFQSQGAHFMAHTVRPGLRCTSMMIGLSLPGSE
jgi:hypothetical protein